MKENTLAADNLVQIPKEDSVTLRLAASKERIRILSVLIEVLQERRLVEHKRNSLLQRAILLEHQVHETKYKCEELWKEKISDLEAIGRKLENQCSALRTHRQNLHKQIKASVENMPTKPVHKVHDVPSIRANYKIQALQMQKSILELKRRVNNAEFRVKNEKMTKARLTREVRKLRDEAESKKLQSISVRPTTMAIVEHPAYCRPTRESIRLSSLTKNYAVKRPGRLNKT